jgi:hypothetical protein
MAIRIETIDAYSVQKRAYYSSGTLANEGDNTMLKVTIGKDMITIGERFAVAFQRTLRIPDDGRAYPLPPGLGRFPILKVEDYLGAARHPSGANAWRRLHSDVPARGLVARLPRRPLEAERGQNRRRRRQRGLRRA